MGKKPADELNKFINRLAIWLEGNQPDFVSSYNVTAQHVPSKLGEGSSKIRFVLTFEIADKKITALSEAGMIGDL